MQLRFSPTRSDIPLELSVSKDLLTVNGQSFDFSPLPEGAILPLDAIGCEWFAGDVMRRNGEVHLTLRLPHGPDGPEAVRFPSPITVTEDGPVALPPFEEFPE